MFVLSFLGSKQNIQIKLSEREIAEAWAKITIQLWGRTWAEWKSVGIPLETSIEVSNIKKWPDSHANVDWIEFTFNYYGKFL